MENSIYIGLSRQTALRREMSVVANNIANMDTTGFKKEMMIYQTYTEQAGFTDKLAFVIDQGTATDYKEGDLKTTGDTFDLAIRGPGYFQVDDGTGTKYTRNGTFTLDENNRLVTQQGFPVLDTQGNPIVVPTGSHDIVVSEDGAINLGEEVVGQLGVVEFDNLLDLKKDRNSLYSSEVAPTPATNSKVAQGVIETSNVNPIVEMTNMINIHRSYDAVKSMIDSESKRQQEATQRLARPMQGA
ncbi:MAG: flagellar basal-body rod protein FlgF [Alphaproteobacteria bacterium]|nr:flagellar basal-body rod protein FlgF [Alphaproteobacteria bacterium]